MAGVREDDESKAPISGVELAAYLRTCVAVERSRVEALTAGGNLRASGYAKLVRWIARELVASAVIAGARDALVAMVEQGGALKRLEGTVQGGADRIPYTTYKRLAALLAEAKAAYLAQVAATVGGLGDG